MGPPTRSLLATLSKANRRLSRPVSSARISRNMALARAALKSAWARRAFISAMTVRLPLDYSIRIHVNHLAALVPSAGNGVPAINVLVAMNQQPWLKDVLKTE